MTWWTGWGEDYRWRPLWRDSRGGDFSDRDEQATPGLRRRMQRYEAEQNFLKAIDEPHVQCETTILRLLGGHGLQAKGPDGRTMKWCFFFPRHRAVLDVFGSAPLHRIVHETPSAEELRARHEFCKTHGLRYAVVSPGDQLTMAQLVQWLTSPPTDPSKAKEHSK